MTVTLDTCADEPIHIPGAIQPHGVLFACEGPTLIVTQVSANVEQVFGVAVDAIVGKSLGTLCEAGAGSIAAAFAHPEALREVNPLRVEISGRAYDAVLHVALHGQLLVELEETNEAPIVGFDPRLRGSSIRLQAANTIGSLCEIAAREVRDITGFDRVMVYRFDPEWNGEVVAEAKRDDLEPFLGQHYPASDIPAQARRLYTINWLRFIADVEYKPVPVLPDRKPALDMSFSILRSVSPIHIEYMKNMGVTASMSVSLIHDGVLIGLIACHHYTGPRLVSFRSRDTAEYLGRALSWNLKTLEDRDRAERAKMYAEREIQLVRSITANDFLDGVATRALLEIVDATGATVVLQEGSRRVGECPPEEDVERLISWLVKHEHEVFSTDHVVARTQFDLGDAGCGVLAVAISRALREYLIWFRPSTERTIDWAGDPNKVTITETADAPPRLSPRGSFALWRETVKGRSEPWDDLAVAAASNFRTTLLSGVRVRSAELRDYNQRLLDADRAKDNFIATVSHELRTPLNAITGWAQMLGDPATQTPDRLRRGLEVISRNAAAQTQIVEDLLDVSRMVSGKLSLDLSSLNLHDLVVDVLASIEVAIVAKGLKLKRTLDPLASIVLGDSIRLRQVVANLMNNAIKFTPKGGSISVTLRRVDSDVELAIRDSGQGIAPEFLPLVFDVFRQADSGFNRRTAGLGLGLAISKKLVELHGGRITAHSDGLGTGALFCVRIPLASAQLKNSTPPQGGPALTGVLAGIRILVVEDERDSRELLGSILNDAGAAVTLSESAAEALATLAVESHTILVSDLGMPDVDGLSMIRELRSRPAEQGGTLPAVALTAYTRSADRSAALDAGFDAHLGKPVDSRELIAVISSLVKRARR